MPRPPLPAAASRARELRRSVGRQLLDLREERELRSARSLRPSASTVRGSPGPRRARRTRRSMRSPPSRPRSAASPRSGCTRPSDPGSVTTSRSGSSRRCSQRWTDGGNLASRSPSIGRPAASSTSCSPTPERPRYVGGDAHSETAARSDSCVGGREGRCPAVGERMAVDGPGPGDRAVADPALDPGDARGGRRGAAPVRLGVPGSHRGGRGGAHRTRGQVPPRGAHLGRCPG